MVIPEFGEIWLGLVVALLAGGFIQKRLDHGKHAIFLVIVFSVSLLPLFDGLSLAQVFRGVLGELSITTLVLLILWNLKSIARFLKLQDQKHLLLFIVAIFAIPFYWASLGGAPVDPYGWGYGNWYVYGILIIGSLLSVYKGYYFIPVIVLAAMLAEVTDLLESTNLWDYLFDPALAIYAIVITSRRQYILALERWRQSR
ncbi:MAG: hypothetical protein ACC707_12915 [Thiohalomonadales bacterium]